MDGVAPAMNQMDPTDQATKTFLRIEAIFNEAFDVAAAERPALIEAQTKGDKEMAAEVWSLLRACEEAEHVTASRQLDPQTGREAKAQPRRIGPYMLDRLLGRGGMGAVHLAHRADGEFKQDVAIKLIDLPLATDLFRERFRQERQILAGLQHPFIARLLDGGVTQDGDPYLVMEYVDGMPIQKFCDAERLTLQQRIALFLRVCEAVQFAHQNLVVHRDLKPDNILVAEDSTPRLLDFGTAKLLSPDLSNAGSEFTREGYQSFTPQYASPEQILGNPITTASDTYSLGVLLYLLLTGSLPYELKELTTSEMLRVVCEEPPRRPTEAVGSNKRLDPDLEAILLKALRKEPQERYLTAEQLALDVRAWLEGQPVGARRGTLRYRAQKFVRRHRLGLAGAALLAATMLAGVVGVLWQARVANQERRKAEARSADLRQLSNSLLSELDEAIKELPGSTGVQKLLVTRVLEHLDRMAQDAKGDRQTQLDLIDAYTRLGNIQGNPYEQNLGDATGGVASVDKAIVLAAPLAPLGSKDREALRALALAQESRSEILFGAAKSGEAVTAMRSAVVTYDRLISFPNATPELICAAGAAYGGLGDELGQSGTASLADSAAALVAFRKAMALDERALAVDPHFLRALRGVAIMQLKIGGVEMETDPAQALKDFQIALQRADALPKEQQGTLATMRMRSMLQRKEANAFAELGQFPQAEELYNQVAAAQKKLADADPDDLRALADYEVILDDEAVSMQDAAESTNVSAADRKRYLATAQTLFSQIVSIMDRMLKRDPANENWKSVMGDSQVRLATVESLQHDTKDAPGALAVKGLGAMKELAKGDQASPMILDQAANDFLVVDPEKLRDAQFAVHCAERAVELSHRQKTSLLLTLADAYRAAGQTQKSRDAAKEALALLPALQTGVAQGEMRKRIEAAAKGSD